MTIKRNFFKLFVLFGLFIGLVFSLSLRQLYKVELESLKIYKPGFLSIKGGKLIIWDAGQGKFYLLSKEGKFLKSFGKKGQGPGEYQQAVGFGTYDSKIWLLDVSQKILEFDLNGNFLNEKKLNFFKKGALRTPELFFENGAALVNESKVETGQIRRSLILVHNDKEKIIAFATMPVGPKIDMKKVTSYAYTCNDRICYVVKDKKKFSVYRLDLKTAEMRLFMEKKFKRVPYTEEELKEIKERWESKKKANPMLAGITIEFDPLKPAISDLVTDKKGNLYLFLSSKGNKKCILVKYNNKGKKEGEARITCPALAAVQEGVMYVIQEGGEDNFYLLAYKMQ